MFCIVAVPGWGGDVVGLLVGSGMGSKTPTAGCSRDLGPLVPIGKLKVGTY